MNYAKLTTENSRNALYANSMGKLHRITHLAFNEEGHNHLFKTKHLIAVSALPNQEGVELLADRYGGDREIILQDLSTVDRPFTNLYIRACGSFFQVAAVFSSEKEANALMLQRDDVAIIDSTTLKDVEDQYHFIASYQKAD